MTTVEIVLITSSQLIRLGKLYATKAEQMLLTMHKSKPTQKKMYQKADKLHLWWFPSCSECKQGCAHMLATKKERKMAAYTMWGEKLSGKCQMNKKKIYIMTNRQQHIQLPLCARISFTSPSQHI